MVQSGGGDGLVYRDVECRVVGSGEVQGAKPPRGMVVCGRRATTTTGDAAVAAAACSRRRATIVSVLLGYPPEGAKPRRGYHGRHRKTPSPLPACCISLAAGSDHVLSSYSH